MIVRRGLPGAFSYTLGPAYIYRGPKSLDEIYHSGDPLVVFAHEIPLPELRRMDKRRVRGFVFEKGELFDETHDILRKEKRAAVMKVSRVLEQVKGGETILLDGVRGIVYIDPDQAMLTRYDPLRKAGPPKEEEELQMLAKLKIEAELEKRRKLAAALKPAPGDKDWAPPAPPTRLFSREPSAILRWVLLESPEAQARLQSVPPQESVFGLKMPARVFSSAPPDDVELGLVPPEAAGAAPAEGGEEGAGGAGEGEGEAAPEGEGAAAAEEGAPREAPAPAAPAPAAAAPAPGLKGGRAKDPALEAERKRQIAEAMGEAAPPVEGETP